MGERQAFYEAVNGPKREALQRIKAEVFDQEQQPDEFSKREVADMLGISYKAVEYRLNKLVEEGKLATRKLKNNVRLYRWVDQES